MIVDVTACPIQGQEMIAATGRHVAAMPKASALAVVCGSPLARMQARRLFTQPCARIDTTQAEARGRVVCGIDPTAVAA